ncbi:similar to Saccharomyces cerevisiae YAL002W VPS8 Membrane-associated protein that interacts with Vps21p to facilitate soluble vacuolar protein localization [Maudiozyma saulgeensis]|uniref:Similar to Saccharomyces cerevisiae YAL002W VPS8 Membrane-associated protein that interacts with Vps21p to facilitate soluble vacuolar protein localization n=1 Tax=Maudiozyma saulgeensis TaxID=1789683 RepID=A0A1X7RAG6_9SACH|nr:similar to Saccharomyces cerevisiae YAL002W VPS8 Membrane-associated protein that interacts with Vps21p to facilitate soluble vacuolar protein localization [Kazachstania saulgeensis]
MDLLRYRPSPTATIPSQDIKDHTLDIDRGPIDGNRILSWHTLTHIYTLLSAYGGPACFLPANAYYVLGSTKGPVLIFDDKEYLQSILAPSCKATTNKNPIDLNMIQGVRSPVTHLAVSWDGTHLAAAYETGDIFIWDLNNTTDNKNDQNVNNNSSIEQILPLYAIIHITKHIGSSINGLMFRGKRHTALVVSDLNGNITYHNGHRTRLWQLTYSSTGILTVPSNEILLSTSLHTVGKSDGILAILTNKLFCLTALEDALNENDSVTSKYQKKSPLILYQKNIVVSTLSNDSNGIAPNNGIAWYTDPTTSSSIVYLSYFINSTITVLVLRTTIQTKFQLLQNDVTWNAPEPILSITWVSKILLMILTVSHQLIFVQPYDNFKIIMKIDLLPQNLLIPPNKFFKFYHNKLILLTHYSLKIAKFNQWSTLTLKKVQRGNYLGALDQLYKFSDPNFTIPSLLSLKMDPLQRKEQLHDTFNNLTFAALKFLLKKHESIINEGNELDDSGTLDDSLDQLLGFAIKVQAQWFPDNDEQFLQFLDLTWDSLALLNDKIKMTFIKTIIDLITNGTLSIVPPSIFQRILQQLGEENNILSNLETLLFNLTPSCWDADLLVRKLQQISTTDNSRNQILLPYIWNIKFKDFLTPFIDLIYWIRDNDTSNCELFKIPDNDDKKTSLNPRFVYDYLTYLYSDTYYPSGQPLEELLVNKIKSELSYILFNGVAIHWPLGSESKLNVATDKESEQSFPYFNLLLNYDVSKFLATLNGIMEATFLNEDENQLNEGVGDSNDSETYTLNINRQYIVDILLEFMNINSNEPSEKEVLIAVFLALNIPKYPQFIRVSSYYLDIIVHVILYSRSTVEMSLAESAIEALLPLYEPSNVESFVLQLKENKFYFLLMTYYKINKRISDMFSICFSGIDISLDESAVLLNDAIKYILQFDLKNSNPLEYCKITDIFKKNFNTILKYIGTEKVVAYVNKLNPSIHDCILSIGSDVESEKLQIQYLDILLSNTTSIALQDSDLSKKYISLSCKYDTPDELHQWLKKLDFEGLSTSTINDINEKLTAKNDYEALAIIYFNQADYEKSVQNMVICIDIWFLNDKIDKKEEKLIDLINYSIRSSSLVRDHETKQRCWIQLLSCLVKQYSRKLGTSGSGVGLPDKQIINKCIQYLFVKLSFIENDSLNNQHGKKVDPRQTNFWHILAGVLEEQDIILMKVHDINELLQEVFTTYNLEEQISKLILNILEQSSSLIVEQYRSSLKQGWSLINNECEVCGKKLWGIDLESKIARIWEAKRRDEKIPKPEIFNGKIVLFRCNHGFHTKCLENLGQKTKRYSCLTCHADNS